MPYAPGASYQGANIIAESRVRGGTALIEAIMGLVGGLTHQASQAKEYRQTLTSVDPQNADKYKSMGLDELRGTIGAMEMKQKTDAAKLFAQEAQGRIDAAKTAATNQGQVGPFFNAWQGNVTGSAPDFGAMAAGQGPRRIAAPMSPIAGALSAAAQYPGGAQASGFARDLPALLRSVSGSSNTPQAVIPFTLGEGDNVLSGGIETRTGKTILDPNTTKRINEAKRGPLKVTTDAPEIPDGGNLRQKVDAGGKPVPGLYEVLDKAGKVASYWHNKTAGGKASTEEFMNQFGGGGAGPATQGAYGSQDDVVKAYKSGKLKYDEAAKLLNEQFGVPLQ